MDNEYQNFGEQSDEQLPEQEQFDQELTDEAQPYQQEYQQPNDAQNQRPPMPSNHLDLAILSTILCCLPLGIMSIICASKVNRLYMTGDYAGANEASKDAEKYAHWAAIAGIICMLLAICSTAFTS